ncbi:retrovirus-related pol polyprotein from transposon TNT 1-94 [Tanacetum coccineum]|uniref:Retrovirus-related pol polyprotein from transposon TNT 1-94 n=1 Tax=Tanacetum coccineum TaxID=301880 RepID=A0ABQ4YZ54_9ASTR
MENKDLKAQIQEKVFVITSLKNDLRKSKGKEIVENVIHIPSATTIAPGMFKLDLVPLPPRLLQNREVHINYLRNTQEQANIIREIVEQVKAKQPLDGDLGLACKYATKIQELLVYVQDTCPNVTIPSTKKIAITPMNNVKKVRLSKPLTSSSNIKQPPGNKKNDRISQTPSRNKKNKVEAQPRKVNKMNRVVKPVCDVDVKQSLSNANSDILCCPDCTLVLLDSGTTRLQGLWGMVTMSWEMLLSQGFTTLRDLVITCFLLDNFDDADLEVVFQKNTCFIRNLEGVDLLSGSRDTHLYTISLDDMLNSSPISKDGLVREIPRLKFQKDHLCSACTLGKSKKTTHQPKAKDTNQEKLYLLHMDLCSPMRVASINGKRYILVIVDEYSRFTWVIFLKTKDEASAAIIKCIKNIQVYLKATVWIVRTDNGTEFVNQTLCEWYENVGISHQTSVARTPQQNGVVERRNRTLVEAARTMLIFSKTLLFLWAEAINTACYTQNRSLIRLRYNKTPYELMQDKKLDLSFFHVFGSLCYPTNDLSFFHVFGSM